MDYSDKIARYEEIEKRGLLGQLPIEKQEAWAEYKRRQTPELSLTDEQKAQIQSAKDEYARKQAERDRDQWFVSLVENEQENPVRNVLRSTARLGLSGIQGIANAGLNPFTGVVSKVMGVEDTKPIKPENTAERMAELGGEAGYDAAALYALGGLADGAGLLGSGTGATSKIAKAVFSPEGVLNKFVAPAVGGAFVRGYTNPTNAFEQAVADLTGAMTVGGIQGALEKNITNIAGGLKNSLKDNKANSVLSKGIKSDENIAQQISNEAPAVYNRLNDEMTAALEKLTGRKLDIDKALSTQQQRYKDFVSKNADVELYSPKSAQEQSAENFKRWFEGSKVVDENGQPLKLYHGTDADFDAFDMSKGRSTMDIQGAFFSPYDIDAKGYGPNLKEVYLNIKNPADEATAYKALRKYQGQNDAGLKAKQDLQRQGFDGVFNGYDEYIAFEPNQIKSVNNSGAWSSSPSLSDAGWTPKASLKNFTQGLNEFQENALNQALNKGSTMSTNAKGSLGATHRAQEVLNDMINASYDTKNPFKPKATTETSQLMKVKDRLNQILEPSGIKPFDEGIAKSKSLQTNFEKGYNFKPSEIKFENLGLETLRDKKAFLQGRIQKITDNVLSDGGTSISKAIQKDENTLRKLMPEKKFNQLMNKAGEIETQFKRLKSLEGQANRELVKDAERGSSINRENWESKGALLGRISDILGGAFARKGRANLAKKYLDPETTQIIRMGGLRGLGKGAGSAATRQTIFDLLNRGE